jgi:hypothetical protein
MNNYVLARRRWLVRRLPQTVSRSVRIRIGRCRVTGAANARVGVQRRGVVRGRVDADVDHVVEARVVLDMGRSMSAMTLSKRGKWEHTAVT